jgi:hypothetical protein
MRYTRGTTLVEFILYVAIATGILLGVGGAAFVSIEAKEKARAMDEARRGAKSSIALLEGVLDRAAAITVPAPGESTSTLRVTRIPPWGDDVVVVQAESGPVVIVEGKVIPLAPPGVTVSGLRFDGVGSASTSAVRIALTAEVGGTGVANTYRSSTEASMLVAPRSIPH